MGSAPSGYQTPKTNWAAGDIPTAQDFNRIENNIRAIDEGSRTIEPTQVPSGNTGTLRQLLDWFANRIKAILGTTNWYDSPPTTLQAAKNHIDAAAPHSGHETPSGAQAKVDAALEAANNYTDQAVSIVRQDLMSHKNETMQYGQIELTVGSGGDFDTINSALEYLSKKYPSYVTSPTNKTIAVIRLLPGFIMQEQVLVKGLNLGWVVIIGDDDETIINRSALTSNFTIDDYNFNSYPAFGVSKGGVLPIIGQLFVMDDSGDSLNRHGIIAVDNSRASILTGCGVRNAGSIGIYANRASIISANGANASNAGTYGIYANQASIISANGANASNAGTYGIYANQASTIDAWGADASGAGGRGVCANQASIINAVSVNARRGEVNSAEDIYVSNGSIIKIASTGGNQTIGGTNQAINTLTGNGIIFG